ncbi:helix-turn-helix transcriptional regulator [Streptomyces sp. NPDC085524]|uniref:helix-turn-helix transcriptional regulator n=1 Tax=unclassified Streptomyces TaxID=2593676 RepID=UPI0035DAFFFB
MNVPGFHNPVVWEQLPDARMSRTARDVFDILTARQHPGGEVEITQAALAKRLAITQSAVSRAVSELKDLGIVHPRTKHGRLLINPLLAGYESAAHMVNHINDPGTEVWDLKFTTGEVRPPKRHDPRTGTDFDPDPDGGEDMPLPEVPPTFRLAG